MEIRKRAKKKAAASTAAVVAATTPTKKKCVSVCESERETTIGTTTEMRTTTEHTKEK